MIYLTRTTRDTDGRPIFEIAVCEAYHRRGQIPADVMPRIRALKVDVARILAIQERVKHEMISLLTSIEEQLDAESRFALAKAHVSER